jgi:hypothetical protein
MVKPAVRRVEQRARLEQVEELVRRLAYGPDDDPTGSKSGSKPVEP